MGRSRARGGGRGGRGNRGRGHSRTRNGSNSQSRAPKTTANKGSSNEKYKRSDNLKDPINYYSMGSSTAHLVEISLITQVVRDHLARTLRNGSDIAKMIDTRREIQFDSEKPRPVKKPKADEKNADVLAKYDLDHEIQRREIEEWMKKKGNYNENKTKAFLIILAQCTDRLKERICNQSDYDSRVKDNPLELLKDIELLSISHTEDKYDMAMIHEALRSFLNLHQHKNEPLSRYSARLTSARDILVRYLG